MQYIWFGFALLTRLLLIAGLYLAFGGQEYTDDISIHLALAENRWVFFECVASHLRHHPPLMGLLESSLLPLVNNFGAFWGMRLGYLCWELLGTAVLANYFWQRGRRGFWIQACIWFCPLTVYAAVVSAQDEVIAYAFAALSLYVASQGRVAFAYLLSCLAVIAAKILFVPVALAWGLLLFVKHGGRSLPVLLLGVGIVALPYLIILDCDIKASYLLPANHTINAWQWGMGWAENNWAEAARISIFATLILAILPVAWACVAVNIPWQGWSQVRIPEPVSMAVVGLLALVTVNYHVVPEYILIVWPLLMMMMQANGYNQIWIVIVTLGITLIPIVTDVLRYFTTLSLGLPPIDYAHRVLAGLVSLLALMLLIFAMLLATQKTYALCGAGNEVPDE